MKSIDLSQGGPARAALDFLFSANPELREYGWHVVTDRIVLDDGDEVVILVPSAALLASSATGWRMGFRKGIGLRVRATENGWEVVGAEDPADHLETATLEHGG